MAALPASHRPRRAVAVRARSTGRPILLAAVLVALMAFAALAPAAGATTTTTGGVTTTTAGDTTTTTGKTDVTGGLSGGASPSALNQAVGPDVSSWNHPNGAAIDWNQVAAAGNSFAFIKATEGPSTVGAAFYTNPYFAGDWSGARNAGLYRGAYDFARPGLPLDTATAQAQAFVSVAGTLQGSYDLPPVLDLEVTGGLSPADLTAWTHAWLVAVQNLTGRLPLIYTSPNFWATALGGTTTLQSYRLWQAQWTSASTPTPIPGWGSNWSFWQYTDAASVPGISGGATDVSRFNGPPAALAGVAGTEAPTTGPTLYLRDSNTSGVADTTNRYGAPSGGTTLMCDWDGNGTATAGVFLDGVWYVSNTPGGLFPETVFGYGDPGDIPVCGDWDGNGTVTPGVVRNGVWYLSNTLGSGLADVSFGYGNPGDIPVVGDWNGDGRDTPGVVRNGVWYLSNALGAPYADLSYGFGNAVGDIPVVGDWNNDGHDTPGVVRGGIWYLCNTLGSGWADEILAYGNPGDRPVAGRWNRGAPATVGITR